MAGERRASKVAWYGVYGSARGDADGRWINLRLYAMAHAGLIHGLIFGTLLGSCVVEVAHIFPPLVGYAQATPFTRCARRCGVFEEDYRRG